MVGTRRSYQGTHGGQRGSLALVLVLLLYDDLFLLGKSQVRRNVVLLVLLVLAASPGRGELLVEHGGLVAQSRLLLLLHLLVHLNLLLVLVLLVLVALLLGWLLELLLSLR